MAEQKKRVLVVDDEADAREFVRAVVEDLGHAALEAADGEEALGAAREHIPDLIILDVHMPKRDGFAVFGELRQDERTRDIPVVMLTGLAEITGVSVDAGHMEEYLGAKPQAYVDKPVWLW